MALRQNVNWILLQEARGKEVDDLLDAMSTGHTVLTTMHTRGADTVTTRIKQMMKNDAESMSSLEMRVYSLVDLVVHLKKETGKHGIVRSVDEIIEYLYDPKSRQCTQHVLYRARTGRLEPLLARTAAPVRHDGNQGEEIMRGMKILFLALGFVTAPSCSNWIEVTDRGF